MGLGLGEYAPDGKHSNNKQRLRLFFLDEIQNRAIRALESLRDTILIPHKGLLPVYSHKTDEIREYASLCRLKTWAEENQEHILPGTEKAWIEDLDLDMAPDEEESTEWYYCRWVDKTCHPELIPIRDGVLNWSKDNNLDGDWWRGVALNTLRVWAGTGCDLEFYWYLPPSDEAINELEEASLKPSPNFPQWKPAIEREEKYLQRIDKEIRNEISNTRLLGEARLKIRVDLVNDVINKAKNYCKQVDEYYRAHGWKKFTKQHLTTHLAWAVDFQVNKKRAREIAQASGISEAAVTKAVNELLALIGLRKRTDGKPGRPVGLTDSPTAPRQMKKS